MKTDYKDDDKTSTTTKHDEGQCQIETNDCDKKLTDSSTPLKCNQNSGNEPTNTYIDVKKKLEIFFRDIDHLLSMGLIRTFENEIECGVVAGNDRMNGGILKSQERCIILSLLGGSIHGLKSKNKPLSNLQQPHLKRQKLMESNEILRQMKSQRSIHHSFAKSDKFLCHGGPESFLPIQCHLHSLIFKNLCEGCNDYINSKDTNNRDSEKEHIYRSSYAINSAYLQKISMLQTTLSKSQTSFSHGKANHLSCICLREKPLQTLRRFIRLYIIASEGPGNMRLGAWLSVHDDFMADNSDSLTSITNGSPWHKVGYPGLKYRLRLQEYNFTTHYEPLTCSFSTIKDKKYSMAQVYRDGRSEFKKWEISVEIRSSMDFLLAKHDLEKSLKRREFKEMKNSMNEGCSSQFYSDILELRTFLDVSDGKVRLKLIKHLLTTNKLNTHSQPWDPSIVILVENTTNAILLEIFGTSFEDKSEYCDTKQIIVTLCIISALTLHVRVHTLTQNDVEILTKRPWLRHLRWEVRTPKTRLLNDIECSCYFVKHANAAFINNIFIK